MKTLLSILLISLLTIGCSESNTTSGNKTASQAFGYKEGVHYITLAQPFDQKGTQNTVTEYFWYGCPHCRDFEPTLKKWKKNKPFNTILKKSPAIWNEALKLHAKLFFIAETMNIKAEAVHTDLFNAVIAVRGEQNLDKQKARFAQVFEKHGMPREQFEKQLKSFQIEGQVERAEAMMKQAQIRSTPTVIVNGKYQIQNQSAKNLDEIMEIANYLIEKGS